MGVGGREGGEYGGAQVLGGRGRGGFGGWGWWMRTGEPVGVSPAGASSLLRFLGGMTMVWWSSPGCGDVGFGGLLAQQPALAVLAGGICSKFDPQGWRKVVMFARWGLDMHQKLWLDLKLL